MASIAILDIRSVGYDLFVDNESYLSDLNENELDRVVGGTEPVTLSLGAIALIGFGSVLVAGGAGYLIGRALS